jgi:hypothetical protein
VAKADTVKSTDITVNERHIIKSSHCYRNNILCGEMYVLYHILFIYLFMVYL